MLVSVLLFSLFVSANEAQADEFPIVVYVDGEEVSFNIAPNLVAGTTLVQMRPIFEALGIELTFNSSTKTITAVKEGLHLSMTLNSDVALLNGKQLKLSRPAQAVHGHTMVPLRFVSEATGAYVHWNKIGREILVITEEFVNMPGLTHTLKRGDFR